jgi:hypothetical protein
MGKVSTIGLDLAKSVFQVHGADASGAVLFSRKLRRHQVLAFFASQPPCTVAMEACSSSHHWAREIRRLGHQVRLIPPAYVKPFIKRQKNDVADAEAICEAAQRPTMRFVAPKSQQAQAAALVFRAVTSWCGSEPRLSMPCAGIWPSSGSSWPKARLTFHTWCRLSRMRRSRSRRSPDRFSGCSSRCSIGWMSRLQVWTARSPGGPRRMRRRGG